MGSDLDDAVLAPLLRGSFGRARRLLHTIDSTNSEALGWALEGAPEGAVVVADHQSAGRGRRGRTWHAAPGAALLFSVVLRPRPGSQGGLLTTALGVAVCEGVEETCALRPALKWPNDVEVDGRKLAGILVESRPGPAGTVAVAGVGLNVAPLRGVPPEVAARATSLADALGATPPPRAVLLAALLGAAERRYGDLTRPGGADEVVAEAARRSSLLGRAVTVRLGSGEAIEGLAVGLGPDGSLELEVAGERVAVTSGEVERVRPA